MAIDAKQHADQAEAERRVAPIVHAARLHAAGEEGHMKNLFRQGLKRFVAPEERRTRGPREAKVICVASLKGGVGKTTTSCNVASALARFHQQRVLLMDLDPQGHVGTSLRKQLQPGGGGSLADLLTAELTGHVMDVAVDTSVPGLRVTPSDAALGEAENLLGTKIGKELILRDALEVTRSYYDVVVIDCPPNLGNLTLNALVASDYLLVPCDLSPLAVRGVENLLAQAQLVGARLNPSLDLLGVVITRLDGRTQAMNDAVLASLNQSYGDSLLKVRVGVSTSISRAQHEGAEIFEHDGKSRGAIHYRELAAEIARRIGVIS
jgi:chromosome partitioning protein